MIESSDFPNCCQVQVVGGFPYDHDVKAAQREYETNLADAKADFERDRKDGWVPQDAKFSPEDNGPCREDYDGLDLEKEIADNDGTNISSVGLMLATTRSDNQQEAGKALKKLGFKQLQQFKNRDGVVLILWGKNNRPVEKPKALKKGTKKASKKAKK